MIWVYTEQYNGPQSSVVPAYVQSNPGTYGASPTSGQGGWWTHVNGPNGTVLTLWRANEMNRLIALGQHICSHILPDGYTVDTSPWIEAVSGMQAESAALPTSSDTTYSDSAWAMQLEALADAMATACPHTITGNIINWMASNTAVNPVITNMVANGAAMGSTDTFASSSQFTSGWLAWMGQNGAGSSDQRGKLPWLGAVQSTELGDESSYTSTPPALFSVNNNTFQTSHIRWQMVTWESGANAANNYYGTAGSLSAWQANPGAQTSSELYQMVNSPLTHTACPTSYVNGCNTD